jgi:hypothetical protein
MFEIHVGPRTCPRAIYLSAHVYARRVNTGGAGCGDWGVRHAIVRVCGPWSCVGRGVFRSLELVYLVTVV